MPSRTAAAAVAALAAAAAAQGTFTPGDVFAASNFAAASGEPLINITAGGDFGPEDVFADLPTGSNGQIAWSADLSTAYASDFGSNAVVAIDASGNVTTFATGILTPTGVLVTADGRVLAASLSGGSVRDITAGGDASAAPVVASFASVPFSVPRNLLETSDGRILITGQVGGQVRDITAIDGGPGVPFATGLSQPFDLVETADGRILVSDNSANAVFDITGGGDFAGATPFATGFVPGGLAVDGAGRVLAMSLSAGDEIVDISAGGNFSGAPPFATLFPGFRLEIALDAVPLPPPAGDVTTWIDLNGGSFANGSSWDTGMVPASGDVVIDTLLPVAITVPAGFVGSYDSLVLRAAVGRSRLGLGESSLIALAEPFTLDASGELRPGAGLFASGDIASGGVILADRDAGTIAANIENTGRIEVNGPPNGLASLVVTGAIDNAAAGDLVLRDAARLEAASIANAGAIDVVGSVAEVFAPIESTGVLSVSAGSVALLFGDLTNDGAVVVAADSSLSILGMLSGNGVEGPGGPGTAGTVFVRDGLAPGGLAIGEARFDGDLSLGAAATTTLAVDGPDAFDRLVTSGTLVARGSLVIDASPLLDPQPGDEFELLGFAAVSGSFDEIRLTGPLADADASTLLIDGVLRVPAAACSPADINADGVLTFGDAIAFIDAFNAGGDSGDINGDGLVNFGDVIEFIDAFNAGCP